ncbi:MAG TPA: aldose 1-epimerase [Casimicrobiaceae bacterium]|nr:aldose 1-epimerase [Casimicrobiaceae bacterium]
MTATLELAAGPARVLLAPEVGGAIAAYEWNGAAVLRRAGPGALSRGDVRGLASYPLIPFSNRIAQATLRWRGAEYALARYLPGHPHAIHGNGWQRAWEVVERSARHAVLELAHDAAGPRALEWPFAYRARQSFELARDALALCLAIENTGKGAFPFGLGWHPFFPRSSATRLAFDATGVWRTDATQLPVRFEPVPAPWSFSAPRAIGATALDHCFAGWRPPARLRWPETGIAASIAADAACSYLFVYVPPGADYLAVEPVTHMTDAFNRADAGAAETGTRVLAPGESFSCTMRISIAAVTDDPGV